MTRPTNLHHRSRKFWTQVEIARNNHARIQPQRHSAFWPIVILVLAIAILIGAGGCKSRGANLNIDATTTSLIRAEVYTAQIASVAKDMVKGWAEAALQAIRDAQSSNKRADHDFAVQKAEIEKVKADPYYRAAMFVKRIIFWLKVMAGLWIFAAVIGRGLSLFAAPLSIWGVAGNALLKFTHVTNPAVWGLSLQKKWQASKANAGAGVSQ